MKGNSQEGLKIYSGTRKDTSTSSESLGWVEQLRKRSIHALKEANLKCSYEISH
jgi:hypothetical protein